MILGLLPGPHLAIMIAAYSRADHYITMLKDKIESINNSNGIEITEDLSQYGSDTDINMDAYERYLKSKRMMK